MRVIPLEGLRDELVRVAAIVGCSPGALRNADWQQHAQWSEQVLRRRGGIDAVKAACGIPVERRRRLIEMAPPQAPPSPPVDPLEAYRAQRSTRDAAREHREVLERLHRAERELDVLREMRAAKPAPPIIRRERASILREATAVTLWSDWHVEEDVRPETVGGRNEYSPEIAAQRVDRLARAVVSLIDGHGVRFQIRELVVGLLGDIITGYIHEELLESNHLSPTQASLFAADLVESALRFILDRTELERITVVCCRGNHGRTTPKIRISTGAANSYEWLLYHVLKERFREERRVVWQIAEGEVEYLQIYGWLTRWTHGDAVQYHGGVGGVHIPLRKAIAGWDTDRRADVTHCGHFHDYLALMRYIVNGSLIGHNAYAVRIKADHAPARQAFYMLDALEGPCLHTPIWVQPQAEAA